MTEANTILPQNLQDLIANLSFVQAVPLGTQQGIPFVAVKVADNNSKLLEDNAVTCEFKPSIFNVDYKGQTIALCIVQFRLNGSDRHIYTASYDLHNDKQYSDCHDLLAMTQYGLLVATNDVHTFLQFDTNFAGTFNPQQMIKEARANATDYDPLLFGEVSYGLTMQADTPANLWEYLEQIAPALHRWYARMQLESEKVE
ncbi:hypothetical protein LOH54_09795 [Sulfurimonas sp. HSL-3221]|uniref:hypothetical protein n=1 Tax=Sulfurimonadaceae TaxID=2771471 RepID=UPI001E39AAF3|nr:hypothetical protein [Sulfurimonas sp. HSL-3221]UFS61942.1 hypothetical protein LOH54_09795 [Sulfurimonas sp. HSL-3221]